MTVPRHVLGSLALLAAASLWGGLYVVSKQIMDAVPPWTLLAWRYALAGLALAPWGARAIGRGGRSWRAAGQMAGVGAVGLALSVGLQFMGTDLSSASAGAVITSAAPAFIAVFAVPLLGEPFDPRDALSLGLATGGVLLVAGGPVGDLGPRALLGNALLIGAAVTWALYTVLAKKASERHGALGVTWIAILAGFVLSLPVALLDGRTVDWAQMGLGTWLGVVYVGLGATAVAFYLWNLGFMLTDARSGAIWFFAQPVVGSLLGWALLGDRLSSTFVLGAAAVALGVAISLFGSGPAVDEQRPRQQQADT